MRMTVGNSLGSSVLGASRFAFYTLRRWYPSACIVWLNGTRMSPAHAACPTLFLPPQGRRTLNAGDRGILITINNAGKLKGLYEAIDLINDVCRDGETPVQLWSLDL